MTNLKRKQTDRIMYYEKILESLFTCSRNDCSVKAIRRVLYEFTGVIRDPRRKSLQTSL